MAGESRWSFTPGEVLAILLAGLAERAIVGGFQALSKVPHMSLGDFGQIAILVLWITAVMVLLTLHIRRGRRAAPGKMRIMRGLDYDMQHGLGHASLKSALNDGVVEMRVAAGRYAEVTNNARDLFKFFLGNPTPAKKDGLLPCKVLAERWTGDIWHKIFLDHTDPKAHALTSDRFEAAVLAYVGMLLELARLHAGLDAFVKANFEGGNAAYNHQRPGLQRLHGDMGRVLNKLEVQQELGLIPALFEGSR